MSATKHFLYWIIPVIISVFINTCCFAQEADSKEAVFYPTHKIGLVLGHAHVFDGRDEEEHSQILSMPSWGIDYTYNFHPKWGVGLHTDIILEKFKVETRLKRQSAIIERSYPVAPALMGIYKLSRHWSCQLGMGAEFASEENLLLTRAGVEYCAEIPGNWEVFGSLNYDLKWDAYDTWAIGIGIAKKFRKY